MSRFTFRCSIIVAMLSLGADAAHARKRAILARQFLFESGSSSPAGPPVANATSPYWLRGAPYQNHSAGPLPGIVDIVIIGAGMTGASAAYHLSHEENGNTRPSILLLDARGVSAGATGRNGGQCDPQDAEDFSEMLGDSGLNDTLAERAFQLRNIDLMTEFARRHGAGDDELRFGGNLLPFEDEFDRAEGSTDFQTMKQNAWMCSDPYCNSTELWDAKRVSQQTSSPSFRGAVYGSSGGSLWPSKIVYGLVNASLEAGVQLHTQTVVHAVTRRGKQWEINTTKGVVIARHVIYAANAYTSYLLPAFAERIVPVREQVLITKPLPPLGKFLVSLKNDTAYYMQRRDGRIVIGGRLNIKHNIGRIDDDKVDEALVAGLINQLEGVWPRLKGQIEVEQAWTGILSYSSDGLPWVGPVPGESGAFIAAGYTGEGMTHAFAAGKAVAEMALGKAPHVFWDRYLPSSRWSTVLV